MGLDNIPQNYPCVKEGTAIRVRRVDQDGNFIGGDEVGSISCVDTQKANGCPYARDRARAIADGTITQDGKVLGMFGTDCWYRGKWGNYLAEALGLSGDLFYGDNDEGTRKSEESCLSLAMAMEEAYNEQKQADGSFPNPSEPSDDLSSDIKYAIWWLRWVAEKADGSNCWY